MPIDQSEAREEALYAGLADDAPHRPRRRPRRRRRSTPRRDMVVGGLTLAVGLSILAGAVVQPKLTDVWPPARAPEPPPPRAAPAPPQPPVGQPQSVMPASIPLASVQPAVPSEPEPEPPQPAPAAPGQAERPARGPVVAPPRVAPLPETGGRLTLPADMAAATPSPAPAPPVPAAPARGAQPTASFDCAAESAGAAERMVCSDPELAAADRELAQAYGRAMRSGAVAPRDLDLDQHDWAALREDAARYSHKALVSVYAQRIDELNRIAADGPGEDRP